MDFNISPNKLQLLMRENAQKINILTILSLILTYQN